MSQICINKNFLVKSKLYFNSCNFLYLFYLKEIIEMITKFFIDFKNWVNTKKIWDLQKKF